MLPKIESILALTGISSSLWTKIWINYREQVLVCCPHLDQQLLLVLLKKYYIYLYEINALTWVLSGNRNYWRIREKVKQYCATWVFKLYVWMRKSTFVTISQQYLRKSINALRTTFVSFENYCAILFHKNDLWITVTILACQTFGCIISNTYGAGMLMRLSCLNC